MSSDNGTKIQPPWSEDQVSSLNAYQASGVMHPFTGPQGEILIATPSGWVTKEDVPIVQGWAWNWMADWQWNWGVKEGVHIFHRLFLGTLNYPPS
jgi:hypothetical protein